jgi:hypothetical protein
MRCCRTASPARDASPAPAPAAPLPPAAPAAPAQPEPEQEEEDVKEIPEEEAARRAQGLAVEFLSNRDLRELRLSLKARARALLPALYSIVSSLEFDVGIC